MTAHAYRRRLVIMARAPRAGAVKSRLAREIGTGAAAGVYRHLVSATVARLADPRRWELVLAVTPDRLLHDRSLPGGVRRLPQGPGDLGDRMSRLLSSAGCGPVVIVGSDIPGIRRDDVARAFAVLGRRDVVFGPAADGGYWLIGAARPLPPRLFEGVRWSSPHALSDTVANLDGLSAGCLRQLCDLDTGDDYRRLGAGVRRCGFTSAPPRSAPPS